MFLALLLTQSAELTRYRAAPSGVRPSVNFFSKNGYSSQSFYRISMKRGTHILCANTEVLWKPDILIFDFMNFGDFFFNSTFWTYRVNHQKAIFQGIPFKFVLLLILYQKNIVKLDSFMPCRQVMNSRKKDFARHFLVEFWKQLFLSNSDPLITEKVFPRR